MSRNNNQNELQNPATRYFEWAGGAGTVRYYDKEAGANVDVKLPFRFLCLDEVKQVGGGIDRNGTYEGFWSNAVRNLRKQPFTVRSKSGIEIQGYYDAIKGHPGVKFISGLYIAYYDDEGVLQIGYFKIKGAALTAWIEFRKKHKGIYKGAFGISKAKKEKKGATVYYEPVFEFTEKVSDVSDQAARALDDQLQEYLTAYFAQASEPDTTSDDGYTGEQQTRAATAHANNALYGPNDEPPFEPSDAEAPDDDQSIPF